MKKIIIATHGKLASGLKDSAKLIAGNIADEIICYELFPGKSAEDFVIDIKNKYLGKSDIIILCDLFGASVSNEMYKLKNNNNVHIISGVNLQIVLDLLFDDSTFSVKKIKEYKDSIIYLNDICDRNESEDF